jgi:hypothetical protein
VHFDRSKLATAGSDAPDLTVTFGILLLASVVLLQANAGGPPSHSPIVIQSDADFSNCACVTGGDGSQANPFVIGPWTINSTSGAAVLVDGSTLTKSFVIVKLNAAGNNGGASQGVVLQNINAGGIQVILAAVTGRQIYFTYPTLTGRINSPPVQRHSG